jgi:hypothetical protein
MEYPYLMKLVSKICLSLTGSQAWRGEAFECNTSHIFKPLLEQKSLNFPSKDSIAQGFILSKIFSPSLSQNLKILFSLVTFMHARFKLVIFKLYSKETYHCMLNTS